MMTINEWLEENDIETLDVKTLAAIEAFINGSHLAISMQQIAETRKHNAWIRDNLLTKHEQLAGLAMSGLLHDMDGYTSLVNLKNDANAIADKMLGKRNENTGN